MIKTVKIAAKYFVFAICGLYIFSSDLMASKTEDAKVSQQFDSIILYKNPDRKGECSQIDGVKQAFMAEVPTLTYAHFDVLHKKEFFEALQKTEKPTLLILSSEAGAQVVKEASDQKLLSGNVRILYISHQVDEGQLKWVAPYADWLALPSHTLNNTFYRLAMDSGMKAKVIPTNGVPHDKVIDTKKCKEDAKFYNLDPQANSPYFGVILGGDAKNETGTFQFYEAWETQKQAKYLISELKKSPGVVLLVMNGPRTGANDPSTKQPIKDAHRDGKPDDVTTAFMACFKEAGLESRVRLFDFQYNKVFHVETLYYLIKKTGGQIWVNADSSSMLTEAIDLVGKKHVHVLTNEAMNVTHYRHVYATGLHPTNIDLTGQAQQHEEPAAVVVVKNILYK